MSTPDQVRGFLGLHNQGMKKGKSRFGVYSVRDLFAFAVYSGKCRVLMKIRKKAGVDRGQGSK